MSQTFLEDIPEFLEIQRNSFLRVLDRGLIQAFEKINPIVPTSQCKYGLLFYPKEYVLILPEHTITEAFLQGKTYGCKIYVPAVIYNIESSDSSPKKSGSRFKSLKALRITKTTGSRFSEETIFGTQETRKNISTIFSVEMKKAKPFAFKGDSSRTLSWDCFLTMLLAIENLSKKKRTLVEKSQLRSTFSLKTRENKLFFFINQISNRVGWSIFSAQSSFLASESRLELGAKDILLSKVNLLTKPSLRKGKLINFIDQNLYPRSLEPYQQMLKPTLHYLLKKKLARNSVLLFNLKTAQKTRKKVYQTSKQTFIEGENSVLYTTLPKTIRQKSKLAFFQKIPNWVRGRSNTSLIHEALNRLQVQKLDDFRNNLPVSLKKKAPKEWLLPFSKRSLLHPKLSKVVNSQQINGNVDNSLVSESNNFNLSLGANLASLTNLAKPVSRKEWVCIGVLPLMTPRGHFIINGSHRIIISQMARAPGLYYQTGEKVQATIVPSKGAWLRLSIKASDNGEIKIWVRITPQRKMPYKIFIETYKHLEISKTIQSKTGSKFLNLTYKTLNSKIKHLDKHYAIGVVSGQINRTLLNPSSYTLGALGRKRLNERLGINDTKGYLTSKDITLIKDNLLKILGQKSTDLSADDIDHLENRRVRTCGELLQTEIETGMTRLKKAIGKQLDEYSNPDSSLFNAFKDQAIESQNKITNILTSDSNTLKKSPKLGATALSSLNSLGFLANKEPNQKKSKLIKLQNLVTGNKKRNSWAFGPWNFFWLTNLNKQNWLLYSANLNQALALCKEKKNGLFWKKNENLFLLKKKLNALLLLSTSRQVNTYYKLFYQPKKIGITLAQAWLGSNSRVYEKKNYLYPIKKLKESFTSTNLLLSQISFMHEKKNASKINSNSTPNFLSPSKIIGTKAFAGALREFFGSNPLSQYMDQTNPLAEITHKRRLSSLGPGGVDRASAGIAIRGIHPSHYGRICPIETPEGKNAGLVNSMTMWARINNEGFLETPYFKVKGGSLMSQTNNLIPHWNYITTKLESQGALKIVSSDLKIAESAFLPSIALPTRDGSERSFRREKRDYIHFCGISPMQNISVATSLIPFLEHDDATRALMGSNMQRQAVPLLRAKEPLIRTGLEGKVVGESGHALQASCNGIISVATRTFIAIDSFDRIKNTRTHISPDLAPLNNTISFNLRPEFSNLSSSVSKVSIRVSSSFPDRLNKQSSQKKRKFFSNINNLSFLKGNMFQKTSNYNSQSSFSSFLAPDPINSLFYPLNYSFKGFLKDWLNIGWHVGNFYDVLEIQGQEKLEQEVIKKNERSSQNITKNFRNSIYQKPKTLNCWRTFIYRFALTKTEHNKKRNSKLLKKRQRLIILDIAQKALGHSTFLTFLNQKKKPKQKFSVGNESPFFSYRKGNFNSSFVSFNKFPTIWSLPSRVSALGHVNQTHKKQDWSCFDTGALLDLVTQRKKGVITKTLCRENFKITRKRKIHNLQQYTRSNQATVCVQRPAISEGRWVQKGDLIGDCSASKNGVLALGQNIVVAYLPMEGFNFEDAIVVSDRLVHEELYTSLHVQRVEFDMDALVKKYIPRKIKVKKQKSAYKTSNQDWITFNNPHLLESEKENLNPLGIINVGSWVGPGDVLVSKVFPVERKIAPSRHLLAAVFQEKKTKILDTDDTSVRVPKGIHGRVINVKIVGAGKTASLPLLQSCESLSLRKKNGQSTLYSILCQAKNSNQLNTSEFTTEHLSNDETEQGINIENRFSNVTSALEPQEEQLNPGLLKNNFAEAFLTTPFFSLDYEVRQQRITKSLMRADAKENFVFDFGTSPSVFQLGLSKKLQTLSSPAVEQQAQNSTTKNLANLINSAWPFGPTNVKSKNQLNSTFLKGEKEFDIAKAVHSSQTDNFSFTKKKLPVKTLITNPFFFAQRTGKEQGHLIEAQDISFKLINNYSGIAFNANPALVRRVVFQELVNQVTPLNKIRRNFDAKDLNFGISSRSSTTSLETNSYSQYLANNKEIKPTYFASKEKNQGKTLHTADHRTSVPNSKNLTKKNGPISFLQLKKNILFQNSINTQEYKITGVRIYIAERKKLQVGDKMSGRHGNKGIVSTILPREDMPYLPDGTPVDMVLNPLGIPSRMNVGQVFECLLGLAASVCGESLGHTPFDEMYGPEASRSLVYLFLYVSRLRSHADWIFQPNFPGKTLLFDGRTGSPFEQWVTVGRAYMLKLIHMVDEKIHARSIGPRSLVTQQPVKGRARGGGQRLGEMEIWAFEGFGAAYTLQEILTIKSDDIKGREEVESSIISARPLTAHIPETFRITLFELRCLCLNLELNQNF